MRWTKPKPGERAIFKRFLWLPKTLTSEDGRSSETRWLEIAHYCADYRDEGSWRAVKWWSASQEMRERMNVPPPTAPELTSAELLARMRSSIMRPNTPDYNKILGILKSDAP